MAGLGWAAQAGAQTYGGGGPDINQATQERYDGPKARLAVAQFTNKSGKGQAAGVGTGMADMLATALFQSGRYIVLERQTLQDVLSEQDLGASGRVRRETAAPIGQVEGAEILVTAAITEFEAGTSGGGAGVGVSGQKGDGVGNLAGKLFGNVVGKLAGSVQNSHVALDLRLIDTRTSRIVAATSVQGSATDIAGVGALAGGGLSGDLSGFSKTPMEKAIRLAIQDAVQFVVAKTPAQYYRPAPQVRAAAATAATVDAAARSRPRLPGPRRAVRAAGADPGPGGQGGQGGQGGLPPAGRPRPPQMGGQPGFPSQQGQQPGFGQAPQGQGFPQGMQQGFPPAWPPPSGSAGCLPAGTAGGFPPTARIP